MSGRAFSNFTFCQPATFLLVLLLLIAGPVRAQELPYAKPEEVGMSTERLQNITRVFNEYAQNRQMSGSAMLIARKGKVVWHEAYGMSDIEARRPMTRESIFRIASQTKAIVSVGIMILQEEGRLLLHDPVGKYIPEFMNTTVAERREDGGYDVVPARRRINIRDLLTHTAGIDYGTGPARDQWEAAGITGWYFADRDEPIAETVARMASLPMAAHPGERFVYGYSTDILGVVIEKITGQTLEEFLEERIIDPLGMKDTHFYLPHEKVDRLATVYSLYPDRLERAPDPGDMVGQGMYVNGPRKSFSGGAGLLSTAADYFRFLQMLLNGGELDGVRILSRKSVELMTTNHLRVIGGYTPGVGFGLGFTVLEELGTRGIPGSEGEYGWGGAYGSTYWVDPEEELVVVYFKQLRPSNNLDDREKLRSIIYSSIID